MLDLLIYMLSCRFSIKLYLLSMVTFMMTLIQIYFPLEQVNRNNSLEWTFCSFYNWKMMKSVYLISPLGYFKAPWTQRFKIELLGPSPLPSINLNPHVPGTVLWSVREDITLHSVLQPASWVSSLTSPSSHHQPYSFYLWNIFISSPVLFISTHIKLLLSKLPLSLTSAMKTVF